MKDIWTSVFIRKDFAKVDKFEEFINDIDDELGDRNPSLREVLITLQQGLDDLRGYMLGHNQRIMNQLEGDDDDDDDGDDD